MTNPWDNEYAKNRGIPSSVRDEPSGVLLWALANWPLLTGRERPERALDVGCGAGRNAACLAERGSEVDAFDGSSAAIERANARAAATLRNPPRFRVHDLTDGLPFPDASFDLVSDIFVYKHQTAAAARTAYRAELARVLRPDGVLLLSLADRDDGYYSTCPDLPGAAPEGIGRLIVDPVVGIGSVLFSLDELIAEFSDCFALQMLWRKHKMGPMHGGDYLRRTIATLWKPL